MKRYRLIFWCVVVLLCLSVLSNLPQDRYTNVVNGSEMTAENGSVDGESRVLEADSGVEAGLFTTTEPIPLQHGDYRIIFRYTAMAAGNSAVLYSGSSVNPDNSLGVTYQTTELGYPGYGEVSFSLTLDQDVRDFQVQGIYGGDNAFMVHSVSIMSAGLFYTDTILIVLAILLFSLWFDLAFLRRPLALGEAVQDRFVRLAPVFLVVGLGLLVSYPLFNNAVTYGHDVSFHATRLEGLSAAFRDGQFPPRVDPTTLNHKGYAASLMYPNLFWWPVALLRLLGLSYAGAYKLACLAANFASAAFAYLAGSRIFRSRFAGAITSVLCTFAQYRLFSIYLWDAQGEVYAMAFFPLFLWGLYEVYFGECKKWPLLAAGATALIQTHLATTYLTAMFCALFFLVFLPYLLRNKDRVLPLLKSIGLTILLNLWFLVPLLRMMREDMNITVALSGLYTRSVPVTEMFYDIAHAWFSPGPILYFIGAALLTVLMLVRRDETTARVRCIGTACLSFGALFAFLATTLAPWYILNLVPFISPSIALIPFPQRFFSLASPFFALCGGALAVLIKTNRRLTKLTVAMLLIAACFFSSYSLMNEYVSLEVVTERNTPPLLHLWHGRQLGDDKEYLYNGYDLTTLMGPNPIASDGTLTVSDYQKDGTHINFSYTADGATYIDLPLLYYPGYRITDQDGKQLAYVISPDTFIRIENPPQSGSIYTQYTGLWWWRISDCISLAAVLACVVYALWKRRKARIQHPSGGLS